MINFKQFEKETAYQKELFPDKKRYNIKIKELLKNYSTDINFIKDKKFNTVNDVIKYYKKHINSIIFDFLNVEGFENYEEFDIILRYIKDKPDTFIEYVINNNNIKLDINYIKNDLKINITEKNKKNDLYNIIDNISYYDIPNIFNDTIYIYDIVEFIYDKDFKKINFKKYLDEELTYNYYKQLLLFLKKYKDKDYIEIYRMITIPDNISKIKKLSKIYKGIGKYWSYNPKNTNSYWDDVDKKKLRINLKAKVNINNVDWYHTFYNSIYKLKEEQEITLYNNVTIDITAFEIYERNNLYYKLKKKELKNIINIFNLNINQQSLLYKDNIIKYNSFIELDKPIKVIV